MQATPVKKTEYFDHITQVGERWDVIAWTYYRDASKEDLLVEANRHLFIDDLSAVPAILPSGMILRIPVIEQNLISDDQLPPWKRISKGVAS